MSDGDLAGARIALFEARMSDELSELVRRHGGVPTCVPAVREASVNDARSQVASFLDGPASDFVIVLTGAGGTALFESAEHLGRVAELTIRLSQSRLVCRGPKPLAALRRYGLTSDLYVAEPYTTAEVLRCLQRIHLTGARVSVVHYGERSRALTAALSTRGADVRELCLYEWRLPEDVEPLAAMVRRIVAGEFDAVAFTSQIQCRHVFVVAAGVQMERALVDALNRRTIVAAIGPTCRDAAIALGVTPRVVPRPPKMGALINALADYLAGQHRDPNP